jgi:hypothetical protein
MPDQNQTLLQTKLHRRRAARPSSFVGVLMALYDLHLPLLYEPRPVAQNGE